MSALEILAWVVTLFAATPLSFALINALSWPRGRGGVALSGSVSALIPARNEEANIARCVRALAASDTPFKEIIVLDDGSTDQTPEVLRELARELPTLRIISGRSLPESWVGKPHACAQLAEVATGTLLLFVDADVVLDPRGLGRLASLFATHSADLVTLVPRQITSTFVERLVVPLLHLTYVSWFPLFMVWRSRSTRFLAANGQVLAVRRSTYDAIGGFSAVKGEIVDDMAFCRVAKEHGHRVVFADGHHVAACRMYRSAREVWEGFSKNIFEGLGASTLALGFAIFVYVMAFVAPYLLLPFVLFEPETLLLPVAVSVLANVALRVLLLVRHAHPPEGVVLHPVAVLVLLAIAVNSRSWSLADRIVWRGRRYPGKSSRDSKLVEDHA